MAKVAIMGYGTVGSGVYDIIKTNSDKLSRSANGESVDIKYILDIRDFDDHPEKELFTNEFTKSLLEAGKSVVTSNKELVATYGTELLEIARGKNVNYFFEASVGGGIPIIRPMHQCLTANNILKIAGILNGTTNYILDQMIRKGKTFETALKDAQNNGFAERNPAADIEGHDACRKIAILASLASGKMIDYNDIDTDGITNITLDDVKYAAAMDSVIKLIGYAQFDENGKVYSIVSPMVIKNSSPLAGVDGVFNAIMVTGDCVGDVMFYGKGAGKLPTASAVVADVVDAVKHSDRSKKIFWEKPAENIMADIDSKKFEYFVRTTDSAENVQKIFGKCEFVDNIIDNESAFVTSPLTKSEVEEKLAKLSDVVANIRVMD